MTNIIIPKQTKIGKYTKGSSLMSSCGVFISNDVPQIFQQCWNCGDTISLIATKGLKKRNDIINSISDKQFHDIISSFGWRVKGYNAETNTCPQCSLRGSDKWYSTIKYHLELTGQDLRIINI
jgi:predicted RNA-binding Zn-ribbon protein involved in translation (DUF1610 family)